MEIGKNCQLGCVILASGLGIRFGGNKLLAPFRGVPLILHALRATDGIFAKRVVVTRSEDVAKICREAGVNTLVHRLPFRSDTVRLGMEALGEMDGCLFCPGDQPLLRQETVAALAGAFEQEPDKIWRPCFGSRLGAPVLFPAWAFPELLTLPEGMGGGYVAKAHPQMVRLLPIEEERELWDVDTPEDLRRLEG